MIEQYKLKVMFIRYFEEYDKLNTVGGFAIYYYDDPKLCCKWKWY